MSASTANRIKVRCQCGAKLAAKTSSAEHTLTCPRCKQPVEISAAEPESEPEEAACPLCKQLLIDGGPLCVHCGYHAELKRKVSSAPELVAGQPSRGLPLGLRLTNNIAYPLLLGGMGVLVGCLWHLLASQLSELSFEDGLMITGVVCFVLRLYTQLTDQENFLCHFLVASYASIGFLGLLQMDDVGADAESMRDAIGLTSVGSVAIYFGEAAFEQDDD